MNYWAIYRSDRPNNPITFIPDTDSLPLGRIMDTLNRMGERHRINYYTEPRTAAEVEAEMGGR